MQRSALCLICFFICSCSSRSDRLFTKLSPGATGINFNNSLQETLQDFNGALCPYFYNGGGVAIGDVNNDGLQDICFTGNMVKNRLYINRGSMKFDDVTDQSGINSREGWCTGVTMADVNGDGKLDIYICRSASLDSNKRRNLLYINNGDLTFTEEAAKYGLDDPGYSTQASFFDYDKDGNLDMFLISESEPRFAKGSAPTPMKVLNGRSGTENKLFRNDNGKFVNVSLQAGIRCDLISFGLGLSTADINMDGWPDIYVSDDFKEPDYLYINNKDGTFTDSLIHKISHTSLYGMGIDVNDYNNDFLPDVIQADMLAKDNHTQKMHIGSDNFDEYNSFFSRGIPPQYMKNSLQKNNGDGTFSEIGQLAGVSNTDWSWSPLFGDFDNDGLKDIFISNGYKRDLTDLELIRYASEQLEIGLEGNKTATLEEYVNHMPSRPLLNCLFQNEGNDKFEDKAAEWGLTDETFSNGAVYADLDNDGDLDLVVNNIQSEAGIYQNNADVILKNNYLRVALKGDSKNSAGIGTKAFLYAGNDKQYQEQNIVRGFESTVDPVLHFGLGNKTVIDSLVIQWPDGKRQLINNIKSNQTIVANITNAVASPVINSHGMQEPLMKTANDVIDFIHAENDFNDFTIQPLLMKYYSRSGPCLAKADVNGDGREDLFIGDAKGQASALFINNGKTFIRKQVDAFEKDKGSEDVSACFFDADNDGDQDLYVGSGGYEFQPNDSLLLDRLYINDGKGNFTKRQNGLPLLAVSTSCVKSTDVDGDGDIDLFVGGRVVPGGYPASPVSAILINDGKGFFTDATATVCSDIKKCGMITDAVWADINNDHQPDLITVGEWCPIKIYLNNHGKLSDASSQYIHFASKGFWNTISAADMDNDGDIDFILGNQGLNNQYHASEQEPMQLFYKDFDGNGSVDPLLCYYIQGKSYPAYSLDDVTQQIPFLKKKYLHYSMFADAVFNDFFSEEQMNGTDTLAVQNLSTIYLENDHNKVFKVRPLPHEAQYAPVNAIAIADVNNDGKKDLVLAGNTLFTRIKFSRYDANHGMLFYGDGRGNFTYIPQYKSGLNIKGEVRAMCLIDHTLFFGVNNNNVVSYTIPSL